jgi:hypothetical protein
MRNRLPGFILLLLLIVFSNSACTRSGSQPPAPLAVEQIPQELRKAFSRAPADVNETVSQLLASLEVKDYVIAYQMVQRLCNLPVATKEQRMISIRSMFTIQGLLQAAQSQGDQKAAEALAQQRRLK